MQRTSALVPPKPHGSRHGAAEVGGVVLFGVVEEQVIVDELTTWDDAEELTTSDHHSSAYLVTIILSSGFDKFYQSSISWSYKRDNALLSSTLQGCSKN